MSSPNKYSEDIKKIAKDDLLKGVPKLSDDKENIVGALSPFVFSTLDAGATGGTGGTGDGTGGTTTTNGETTEDNAKELDPNDPNTMVTSGGGTGGTDPENDPGTQDFESVMDGEAGPQKGDESQNTSLSEPTGALTGLKGITDCNTSQCVNLHLDGIFPSPDGWESPDTPPDVEGWEQGVRFRAYRAFPSSDTISYHTTFSPAKSVVSSWTSAALAWFVANGISPPYYSEVITDTATSYRERVYHGVYPGFLDHIYAANTVSCAAGVDEACPLTVPQETEWPTDGCYDLALIDGTFQANQYDSEAPANAGGSQVDMCFGDSRTATVYVTANGGAMASETGGETFVYNKDGTLQYAGDTASTNLDQYLPK